MVEMRSSTLRVLGLIPARGGSKGIPRKNIAPFAGRPLVSYTCESALAARSLTRVIASTDDEEIAAIIRAEGVEIPFLRPSTLAQDDTPAADVAHHAIEWLRCEDKWEPDIVVLLQPTSPLRQASDIDGAIARMIEQSADTVVSVVPVPHIFLPWSLMVDDGGVLHDFWTEKLPFDRFHRQGQPVLFARNGPAVIAARTATLIGRNSFYGETIVPYPMDRLRSIDIDEPADLVLAELIKSKIDMC